MDKQTELFLMRTALTLEGPPTLENIAAAMQRVCDRDKEIFNTLCELDERSEPKHFHHGTRAGTGLESPFTTMSNHVYRKLTEARACNT